MFVDSKVRLDMIVRWQSATKSATVLGPNLRVTLIKIPQLPVGFSDTSLASLGNTVAPRLCGAESVGACMKYPRRLLRMRGKHRLRILHCPYLRTSAYRSCPGRSRSCTVP